MSESPVWDKAKGELLIVGRRHVAVDAESLCQHFDALVGVQVAEVILDNHETRLGKEDADRIRTEKPQATIRELTKQMTDAESISGIGVVNLTLPDNADGAFIIEISNPIVKGTAGAAKAFMFSYWRGALSALLEKDLDIAEVSYDKAKDQIRGRIAVRPAK